MTTPEYKREYYLKNKEKMDARSKKWKEENRVKRLLSTAKQRAKQKGFDFSIVESDIKIPEYCPYLGLKLGFHSGAFSPHNISIDRIDPTKGYTKDNIEIISYLANRMKSDATKEQLIKFSKSVLNKFKEE